MTDEIIVAHTNSRSGGRCADCTGKLPPGAQIWKIAKAQGERRTTKEGHGYGRWVGLCCISRYYRKESARG